MSSTRPEDIPMVFVTNASDVLGDTSLGFSGAQIVKLTSAYAVDANIDIPNSTYPFERQGINKRTALAENIAAFPSEWRYKIIRELCDSSTIQKLNPIAANKIKAQLFSRYGHQNEGGNLNNLNQTLVEETKHWLGAFPRSLSIYTQAEAKLSHGIFDRNVLDDLRLALEILLHELLGNHKSLENQLQPLGAFIKQRDGSPELANMFVKLIEYYAKYQNTYIKHDLAVIDQEVDFIFELTSCFMRYLVRIFGRASDKAGNLSGPIKMVPQAGESLNAGLKK